MVCSSGELHAIYFLWAHVFYVKRQWQRTHSLMTATISVGKMCYALV